jgi:hypothetical protein
MNFGLTLGIKTVSLSPFIFIDSISDW